MTLTAAVSIFCMSLVSLLCVAGVLSKVMKDSLIERIGLSILCIGCTGRILAIWNEGDVPGYFLIVHIGMATYAAGSALEKVKLWLRDKKYKEAEKLFTI